MHVRSFLYSHIPSFLLRPLYHFYEGHLIDEIKKGEIPRHVGIIMDGNRRFGKETGMLTWESHQMGADKLEEILDWCSETNIKEITAYAFSTENFERPQKEVVNLMHLFEKKFYDISLDKRNQSEGPGEPGVTPSRGQKSYSNCRGGHQELQQPLPECVHCLRGQI
jgi:tritrans,polycis-undecaprenyl-diphosphate synthase [geranylgeranyl-diphosphate specific]